ncbi:MAG: hypothetical protein J2P35_13605, partial [Actinobacteria bacterium]|nr:hypothetical protein [Actinomycetota bacterium]
PGRQPDHLPEPPDGRSGPPDGQRKLPEGPDGQAEPPDGKAAAAGRSSWEDRPGVREVRARLQVIARQNVRNDENWERARRAQGFLQEAQERVAAAAGFTAATHARAAESHDGAAELLEALAAGSPDGAGLRARARSHRMRAAAARAAADRARAIARGTDQDSGRRSEPAGGLRRLG